MLIHLIGAEPLVDFTIYPQSIILRTAGRPQLLPDARVTQFKLTHTKGGIAEVNTPAAAVSKALGFEPTEVSVTRLICDHGFHVFKAPQVDTLNMEAFYWLMICVQAKPFGGAFVFISKWNETKMYHFLRGERFPSGGIALTHPAYCRTAEDPIDGEKIVATKAVPAWRRLREDNF